jgi:uncharacterized RDD family membrane protein YckC
MYQYAGFWKRFPAAIFDTVLVTVAAGPVAIIPGVILGSSIGSYYAIMESSSHQAIFGKMLVGIRVTGMYGNRISFWRATLRHFAKILSAMVYCLVYLMIASPKKTGVARHNSRLSCNQWIRAGK